MRVMICDDHAMVRTALADALRRAAPEATIVAELSDPADLHGALRRLGSDVLVIDLSTGPAGIQGGIEVLRALALLHPQLAVVVLTAFAEPMVARQCLAAGARGFVAKGSAMEVLVGALRAVASGRRFVDPAIAAETGDMPARPADDDVSLSPREREVLARLCAGARLSSIAVELGISIKTVGTHKMRLMQKLGLRNNAELIRFGHERGLGG